MTCKILVLLVGTLLIGACAKKDNKAAPMNPAPATTSTQPKDTAPQTSYDYMRGKSDSEYF